MPIMLPRINRDYLSDIIHRVHGTDAPIPVQGTLELFLGMKELRYLPQNTYPNFTIQLGYGDDVVAVFSQQIIYSAFDAGKENSIAVATFYGPLGEGTLSHDRRYNGEELLLTNMENPQKFLPYLEALSIYSWIEIYALPSDWTDSAEYDPMEYARNAAVPLYEALLKTQPESKSLRNLAQLGPLFQVPINYYDLVENTG